MKNSSSIFSCFAIAGFWSDLYFLPWRAWSGPADAYWYINSKLEPSHLVIQRILACWFATENFEGFSRRTTASRSWLTGQNTCPTTGQWLRFWRKNVDPYTVHPIELNVINKITCFALFCKVTNQTTPTYSRCRPIVASSAKIFEPHTVHRNYNSWNVSKTRFAFAKKQAGLL